MTHPAHRVRPIMLNWIGLAPVGALRPTTISHAAPLLPPGSCWRRRCRTSRWWITACRTGAVYDCGVGGRPFPDPVIFPPTYTGLCQAIVDGGENPIKPSRWTPYVVKIPRDVLPTWAPSGQLSFRGMGNIHDANPEARPRVHQPASFPRWGLDFTANAQRLTELLGQRTVAKMVFFFRLQPCRKLITFPGWQIAGRCPICLQPVLARRAGKFWTTGWVIFQEVRPRRADAEMNVYPCAGEQHTFFVNLLLHMSRGHHLPVFFETGPMRPA